MAKEMFINKRIYEQLKKRATIAVLLLLIVVLPTIWYAGYYAGRAQTASSIPVFEHPADSYSYLIWKEGNTYYARNGITGAIDYSGTNAAQIIQNTIDALTSGGMIFITSASYAIYNTITVPYQGITLAGEGRTTVLQDYITSGDVIKATNKDFYIKDLGIESKVNKTSGSAIVIEQYGEHHIHNIYLWGLLNGWDGITLGTDTTYTTNVYITNLFANQFQNNAVYIKNADDTKIVNAHILGSSSTPKGYGIKVEEVEHARLKIVNTHLEWLKVGIYINPPAGAIVKYVMLDKVTIHASTLNNFRIEGGTDRTIREIRLLDCMTGRSGEHGLYVAYVKGLSLTNLYVRSNAYHGVWIRYSENVFIQGGFYTNNSQSSIQTQDGLILSDGTENFFVLGVTSGPALGYGDTQRYGIRIVDSSYGIISDCIARGNTVGISLSNATNVNVMQSWNGTTWIP